MFDEIKSRSVAEGLYIAENGTTVRETAAVFGISKSTVHKDVTKKLKHENPLLYRQVCRVLQKNKAERHLRGGYATKMKYGMQRKVKNSSSAVNNAGDKARRSSSVKK